MNYLTHLYLSDGTPEGLVGSLLGDFVKGDRHNSYAPAVRQAIMVHRRLDAFTDHHPTVKQSKRRLRSVHRHTKGILVDLFYDHFLARHWEAFATRPLAAFTAEAYRAFEAFPHPYPERLAHILPYMVADDWLLSYRELANIGRALGGISRRLSRKTDLADGLADLETHYMDLEADFRAFMPLALAEAVRLGTEPAPLWRPELLPV